MVLVISGLHHFYLRRYCWGALYLATVGVFGIGWLIDFFRMYWLVKNYNKTMFPSLMLAHVENQQLGETNTAYTEHITETKHAC